MVEENTLKQSIDSARSIGVICPYGYYLPPMSQLACAVNPRTPMNLTPEEFGELKEVLQAVGSKAKYRIDHPQIAEWLRGGGLFEGVYERLELQSKCSDGWILTATEVPIPLLEGLLLKPGPDIVINVTNSLLEYFDRIGQRRIVTPNGFKVITLTGNAEPTNERYMSYTEARNYFDSLSPALTK
jgi:hypothetical protein